MSEKKTSGGRTYYYVTIEKYTQNRKGKKTEPISSSREKSNNIMRVYEALKKWQCMHI